MKENITALWEHPQEFAAALESPEKAIIFSVEITDARLVEEDVFKLQLYFEELDKNHINSSCQEILHGLVIAANLKIYFAKTEECNSPMGNDKENYFSEKIEEYYEKLSHQKFFDFHQQAKLNNFMGYIYILNQHFLQAGRYYQKAIEFEQKCENVSNENIKIYSIQLASSYLMYNDKYCPEYDNGLARKHCRKSIKIIENAFKLTEISDEAKKDLWAVFIRASDGLAKANYHIAQYYYGHAKSPSFTDKKTVYNKAMKFTIEAIFASIEVLKIGFINDYVKKIFLANIKSSSLLMKQILKNFHRQGYTSFEIPTAEQKISIKVCISFMKSYLEATVLEPKTISTLKKIIRLYEGELILQPVSRNCNPAEFWQSGSSKNNTLISVILLKPGDEENKNLYPNITLS